MVNYINGLNGIKAWYVALNIPKEMYQSDLRDMLKIDGIGSEINKGLSGKTLVDHISTVVEDYMNDIHTGISLEEHDTVMKGYLALNMLFPDDFRCQNRDERGNKIIPNEFLPYVKEKIELLKLYNTHYQRIQPMIK